MRLNEVLKKTEELSWQEKLFFVAENFKNVTFSTSFSIEDQVITDFIIKNKLDIEIFTIDTGRFFKETYQLWQNSLDKYKAKIKAYYPDQDEIAQYVEDKGINAFYDSVELRKKCCEIRKVNPLKNALKDKDLWISGLRKSHSANRSDKPYFEEDKNFGLIKLYPILDFSDEELWDYIDKNQVPYNPLYKKGFVSIGCQPCTRAISAGQDNRAGRWWWENRDKNKVECGLHS